MPLDLNELKRERNLTEPEVKKIVEVVEKTGESEMPYPVNNTEGKLSVLGNPNVTKREPQLYEVAVYVPKATSEYTKEKLESIAIKFEETELEYQLLIEVPVNVLSIDRREAMSYATGIVMSTLYEEVEHEDKTVSMEFITDNVKRMARIYRLTQDPDISYALKSAVVGMLDLPKGLSQITTSQAVATAIEFMENNPDVVNEVDANLEQGDNQ